MSEIISKEFNNKDNLSHDLNNSKDWLNKWIYASVPPNFPHYSSYEDRLNSFDSWPNTMKLTPEVLSEAGFFYLGQDDRTVCFHCGGGLNEWKEFDDPWIEHAYWFPKCLFVLNVKGKEYIDSALSKRQEKASLQETKPAKDILQKMDDLTLLSKKKNSPVKPKREVINAKKFLSTEEISDTTMLCKICYLGEKNILFIPCRHIVACSKCSSKLTKCAVCREPILNTIRVYHT